MIKNKKTTAVLALFLILFSSSYVLAFGVGSAYHETHPLKLPPGGTKAIEFSISNMGASAPITTQAIITKGSNILKITDSSDTYTVPVDGEAIVHAQATIPETAKPGDSYTIELSLNTLAKTGKGSFGLSTSVGRTFTALVVSPETGELPTPALQGKSNLILSIGIAIVIIIIIVIIILKRRKKTNKK